MGLGRFLVSEQQGEAFVQLVFEEGDAWRFLLAMKLFEGRVVGANDVKRRQLVECEVWRRLRDWEKSAALYWSR